MADVAFLLRSTGGFERRKKYLAVLLWGRRRARKRTGGGKLWMEALTRERMRGRRPGGGLVVWPNTALLSSSNEHRLRRLWFASVRSHLEDESPLFKMKQKVGFLCYLEVGR